MEIIELENTVTETANLQNDSDWRMVIVENNL